MKIRTGSVAMTVTHIVCMTVALCAGSSAWAAERPAVIKNRAVTVGGGKEVDALVTVVAVDQRPVNGELPEVVVPAGQHEIEVECTARVFVGMGTVDFPARTVLSVQVEAGGTYQLDAAVNVKGDCVPTMNQL